MTERRGDQPAPSPERQPTSWDPQVIAEALGISREFPPLPLHGSTDDHAVGAVFGLGDPPHTLLELYPARKRLRLDRDGLHLELDDVEPPTIGPEGVIFERSSPTPAWLSLGASGEIALQSTPKVTTIPEAPETAPVPPTPAKRGTRPPTAETPVRDDSAAPQTDPPPALPSPESSPAAGSGQEKPEYIKRLTGRLGGNPRFHETRSGTLVGEFDLAVRDPDDPEQTIWHRVALFGERAMDLRENGLQKGDVVDVIGAYRHVSEYKGKDGTPRRKEELRPTLVKRR